VSKLSAPSKGTGEGVPFNAKKDEGAASGEGDEGTGPSAQKLLPDQGKAETCLILLKRTEEKRDRADGTGERKKRQGEFYPPRAEERTAN